jgi:hypothetical protein
VSSAQFVTLSVPSKTKTTLQQLREDRSINRTSVLWHLSLREIILSQRAEKQKATLVSWSYYFVKKWILAENANIQISGKTSCYVRI